MSKKTSKPSSSKPITSITKKIKKKAKKPTSESAVAKRAAAHLQVPAPKPISKKKKKAKQPQPNHASQQRSAPSPNPQPSPPTQSVPPVTPASKKKTKKKKNAPTSKQSLLRVAPTIKKKTKKKKAHAPTARPSLEPQPPQPSCAPVCKKKGKKNNPQSNHPPTAQPSPTTPTPNPSTPQQTPKPSPPDSKKKSPKRGRKKKAQLPQPSVLQLSREHQTANPSAQTPSHGTAASSKKGKKQRTPRSQPTDATPSAIAQSAEPRTPQQSSKAVIRSSKKKRKAKGMTARRAAQPASVNRSTPQPSQQLPAAPNHGPAPAQVQTPPTEVKKTKAARTTPALRRSARLAESRLSATPRSADASLLNKPSAGKHCTSAIQPNGTAKRTTTGKRASPEPVPQTRNPATHKNRPKKKAEKADKPSGKASVTDKCNKPAQDESTGDSLQASTDGSPSHDAQPLRGSQNGQRASSNGGFRNAPSQTRQENVVKSANKAPYMSPQQTNTNKVSQTVRIVGTISQRARPQYSSNLEVREPYCLRTVRRNHLYKPPPMQPQQGKRTRKPNGTSEDWNAQPSRSQSHSLRDVEMTDIVRPFAQAQPQSNARKRKRASPEPRKSYVRPQCIAPSKRTRCAPVVRPLQNGFVTPRTPSRPNSAGYQLSCEKTRPGQVSEHELPPQGSQALDIGRPRQDTEQEGRRVSQPPVNPSQNIHSRNRVSQTRRPRCAPVVRPLQNGFVTPQTPSQPNSADHQVSREKTRPGQVSENELPPQGSQAPDIVRRQHTEQEGRRVSQPPAEPSQNIRSRNHVSQTVEDRRPVATTQARRQSLQTKRHSPTGEYFGIRYGRDGFSGVTTCWSSCSPYVLGYRDAVYAMFDTWEKAEAFADRSGTGPSVNYKTNCRHFFRRRKKNSLANGLVAQLPWELENEPEVVSLVTGAAWLRFGIGCGIGGYSVFISEHNPYNCAGLMEGHVTEFRLDLRGVLEALEIVHQHQLVKDGGVIEVYTVSEEVKNGIDHWLGRWNRTGQWKRHGQDVGSQDLWKAILTVRKELERKGTRIQMIWVRGPAGVPAVQKAKALARLGFKHMTDGATAGQPAAS